MIALAPTLGALPTYLAGRLGARARDALAVRLDAFALRLPHFAVLVTLRDLGDLAQHELADHLHYARPHLVQHIDLLESRELVVRRRDAEDRRRQIISLTRTGAALADRLARIAQEVEAEATAPLDPDERATLLALLQRIGAARTET